MSLEREASSKEVLGSLRDCFIEGDAYQRKRERRVRQRALLLSTFLQASVAIILLLMPLFAKPAKLALAYMPMPVYSHAAPSASHSEQRPHTSPPRNVCRFCAPTYIPPTIVTRQPPEPNTETPPSMGDGGPPVPGAIPLVPPTNVRPPAVPRPEQPRILHFTHLDPAMLIHRVEPTYPPLAKQIGRSGKVEMHAVISTDGSIQSLEIVSGDPMFYRSALDAVQQWRYRPTILNGQAVEVDTFITVIYNIQH